MQAAGSAWERLHIATTSTNDIREADKLIKKSLCCTFVCAVAVFAFTSGFLSCQFSNGLLEKIARDAELRDQQDNGLASSRKCLDQILRLLDSMNCSLESADAPGSEQGVNRTDYIFYDMSAFELRVNESLGRTIAQICGDQEKGRFIVLSASGHGRDIAINIARAIDELHKKNNWKPRRSWVFCLFYGTRDRCAEAWRDNFKAKIAGYVAIHGDLHGTRPPGALRDQILVSGSPMLQSVVVDAINETEDFYVKKYGSEVRADIVTESLPRLHIDVPHLVLKYNKGNSAKSSADMIRDQKVLGRIVARTMWSLSESLLLRWDPHTFNDTMQQALETVPLEARQEKDALKNTVTKLTDSVIDFNNHLDKVDKSNVQEVYEYNNKLLDLQRVMFCSDQSSRSKSDVHKFKTFSSQSIDNVKSTLKDIRNCFDLANRIIRHKDLCNILS